MPIDQDTVKTVTDQIHRELEQIKSLQATAETRLRDEVRRKENETKEIFEQLMRMQVEESRVREERRKFWTRFVLGPSGLLAAVAGGVIAWFQIQKPTPMTPSEQVEQVEKVEQSVTSAVENRVGDVETRLDRNDEKIKRTVEVLLDQQVQISESTDYIIDKIEKAHPNTRSVDEPEAVTESRNRAADIRRRRKVNSYDPADPLAGLE